MPHSTCTIDGCPKAHRARGLCSTHYNQANFRHVVTCIGCGEEFRSSRTTGKLCSDKCRAIAYRIDLKIAPPKTQPTFCRFPKDHPVRVLTREAATLPGPLRAAYEGENWDELARVMEAKAVKVDDCWLWPGISKGYGIVRMGGRGYGAHRLSAMAARGEHIPSHMPVHHKCAEPLCINPAHLQVITPIENTAEMLERNYYQQRIADLEAALAAVDPTNVALRARLAVA